MLGFCSVKKLLKGTSKTAVFVSKKHTAASMVAEVSRICGRVGFVLGVTSYLGRAWRDFNSLKRSIFKCCKSIKKEKHSGWFTN